MSFDLTNKNIQDTFQNLLQRTGSDNHLYDLEGNKIGDLRISGSLIAQEYVVSSSVTNISIATLSGSTAFGDSSDDTHQFTGSITTNGNLTVDNAEFGIIAGRNIAGTLDGIVVAGDISASGGVYMDGEASVPVLSVVANRTIISSSMDITLDSGDDILFKSEGTEIVHIRGDEAELEVTGDVIVTNDLDVDGTTNLDTVDIDGVVDVARGIVVNTDSHAAGDFQVKGLTRTHMLFVDASEDSVGINNEIPSATLDINGTLKASSTITADGDISSSGDLIADGLIIGNKVAVDDSGTELYLGNDNTWTNINYGRQSTDTHTFNGSIGGFLTNITASGNISSSGTITSLSGSFGTVHTTGNISASGIVHEFGGDIVVDDEVLINGDSLVFMTPGMNTIKIGGSNVLTFDGAHTIIKHDASISGSIFISGSSGAGGHITASGDIKADGDISASGNLYGTHLTLASAGVIASTGKTLFVDDAGSVPVNLSVGTHQVGIFGGLKIQGNITASGDISASGNIKVNQISASGNIMANQITASNNSQIRNNVDAGTAYLEIGNSNIDAGTDKFAGIKFTHGGTGGVATAAPGVPAGSILAGKLDDFLSTAKQDSFLQFNTVNNGTEAERMRLTGAGRVGIGTSVPDKTLTVAGDISASGDFYIQDTNTIIGEARLNISSSNLLTIDAGAAISFNFNELVIDTSTNNVGIGTATPTEQLHISGAGDTRLFVEGKISSSGVAIADNLETDFIPVLPTDFQTNDNSSTREYNIYTPDSGSYVFSRNTSVNNYALKMIPKGFTATEVIIYGDTSTTVSCYSSSLQAETAYQLAVPAADSSNIDITNVVGDGETYISIGLEFNNTNRKIKGGKIFIQPT